MVPEPYVRPPQPKPEGSWLKRGWSALVREHRLPYRVSRLIDSICNAIGLRYKTVRADGFAIRLRRLSTDEMFVHNIVINQEYTPEGYDIRDSDTVIDIGGNIGSFALLAARSAPNGMVFTFEPVEENYRLLSRNIAVNRLKNVVARKVAILDKRTNVKIYLNARNTGRHSVFESYGTDARWFEVVPTITLQDVFREYRIDRCHFLKLDCEGSEYQILYGLPKEYFRLIDKIVMEYHNIGELGARADDLVTFLTDVGYRVDAYLFYEGGGFIRARRR